MAVRIDRELAFLANGVPRDVSDLIRAHLECERKMETMARSLSTTRRELQAAIEGQKAAEERYESLRKDHMELLVERRRLEGRVRDLRERLEGLRAHGVDNRIQNARPSRTGRRTDASA